MMTGKNSMGAGEGKSTCALNTNQVLAMVVIGVVFWFAGAMGVKLGAPLGIFGAVASAVTFAVAFPVSWFGVLVAAKVGKLGPDQILPGIAVGTVAATFCDGIALTWFRWLYGTDPEQVVLGAAWILWGAGAFFAAAFFEAHRQRSSAK